MTNNITTAITEIKAKVTLQEWQQRIMDCQTSGMSVKAWCQANGISSRKGRGILQSVVLFGAEIQR